jgi:hypothetical protein
MSQPLEAFHGLRPTLATTLYVSEVFQRRAAIAARILPHNKAHLALLTENGTKFQEYRRTRTSGTPRAIDCPVAISSLRNSKIAKHTCASCFRQSPRAEMFIFPLSTGKAAL